VAFALASAMFKVQQHKIVYCVDLTPYGKSLEGESIMNTLFLSVANSQQLARHWL